MLSTNECFSCGLENGFKVFNSEDPLGEDCMKDREYTGGGIGKVEMLFRCNLIAMVGGGKHPQYPRNKILIWDNKNKECIIELEFNSEVKAVRLRKDRIVAILNFEIAVFTFTPNPKRLHTFYTFNNPWGLCALCFHPSTALLAFPGRTPGHLQLIDLLDNKRKPCIITAHEAPLGCITINTDGSLVATASEKGTLIRIFDTHSGIKLHELRRGMDRARIYCITFNQPSTKVCVSSDKGTVHVFDIAHQSSQHISSLTPTNHFLPKYFTSQWSFTKFSVPDINCICAFAMDNSSVI
eukprot:Ihof_evm2s679 gene=Ihof_evmTU2s679